MLVRPGAVKDIAMRVLAIRVKIINYITVDKAFYNCKKKKNMLLLIKHIIAQTRLAEILGCHG